MVGVGVSEEDMPDRFLLLGRPVKSKAARINRHSFVDQKRS